MQTTDDVKKFIADKIREKGLSLNELSIQIGKNGTYLFQFVNRPSPKRLGEIERKKLSQILGVEEQLLTDLPISSTKETTTTNNISIDLISATPCCGNGNEVSEERIGKWVMPLQDFKKLTSTSPDRVKLMQASGDSMQPTITDGDFILADISHNIFDVDGIYLIRMANGLAVKRLQAGLSTISIISDNPNYKPIEASIGEVRIIGKVIKILNVRSV